jgi:hypothetical protein
MAAILKAVSHLRFCNFCFARMSQTYLSNFIRMRRKLTELLQFKFFKMAAAVIFDSIIVTFDPKSNVYASVSIYSSKSVSMSLDYTEI